MCDESLLQSVLYTIPDNVESLNITLGFPLKLTTVSSFVERLIDLQSFGLRGKDRLYLPYVKKILRHPFAKYLSPDSRQKLLPINRFFEFKSCTISNFPESAKYKE